MTDSSHVHFFRNPIKILEKQGNEIFVTCRKRDCTTNILDSYGIPYKIVGSHYRNILGKAYGLLERDIKLMREFSIIRPEMVVSLDSPYSIQAANFTGCKSVAFIDTAYKLQNFLISRFAYFISIPKFLRNNFDKNIKIFGDYKELSYLTNRYFKPDKSVLKEFGVKKNEYIVLRLTDSDAFHDIGKKRMDVKKLLSDIKRGQELLIFDGNKFSKDIHSLLYYAGLYIGNGATMAAEAGILGTPSIFLSQLQPPALLSLQKDGLVRLTKDLKNSLELVDQFAQNRVKTAWRRKSRKLLRNSPDVAKAICRIVMGEE